MIVEVFTRETGRLSLIATLPKTQKGKLKKQYFQPMTLLEITFDHRRQVQLQQLKDARLLTAWASIPFTPEKLALSLFTAEFLYHALRSEQQNEPLFAYVCDSIQWLDTVEAGYANFHLTFLMRLSRFLGFYPNLEVREEQRAVDESSLLFDLREGRFCTEVPLHSDFLKPSETHDFINLMRMTPENMHLFRLSHSERNRIINVMMQFYGFHIPGFKELKSLEVLREIFK